MLGGPIVNLVLGILFTAVLLMGFGMLTPTTTVASISQCIVPATQTSDTCSAADPAAPAAGTSAEAGRPDHRDRRHGRHHLGRRDRDHPAGRRASGST